MIGTLKIFRLNPDNDLRNVVRIHNWAYLIFGAGGITTVRRCGSFRRKGRRCGPIRGYVRSGP